MCEERRNVSRRSSRLASGQMRKFHYGLVAVSDGKCRPQPSRVKLCSDYLVLQREEFHIWEDEETYNVDQVQNKPFPYAYLYILSSFHQITYTHLIEQSLI